MIQCVTLTITAVACVGFCITHIALTWRTIRLWYK